MNNQPEHEPDFKCATFDPAMQAAIPPEIRAKMDRDRAAAETKPSFWPCPNKCMTWCRDDVRLIGTRLKPMTNHHPRCEHVDASLIDVWKVSDGSSSFYTDNEAEARSMSLDDGPALTVTAEKMHREIYENLPEFDGF